MRKAVSLDVSLETPQEGLGWIARVEVVNSPGRAGIAESDSVGEAFERALLVALASGVDQEGSRVSC